eukprot:Nitzschia sp. Nitz4//scaffold119_size111653//95307//95722//NITZ4_004209-RA/size111653-augustus-gene-0.230-mRNA-1//-1//CDS//3329533893//1047//frame0
MSYILSKIPPNQRILAAVGTLIVGASVFKACYFQHCRQILVEQADRTHIDATEHYKEAKEFAKWSAKDREERRAHLPPLTLEQEQQIRAYLRIMQEHHAFNPASDVAR